MQKVDNKLVERFKEFISDRKLINPGENILLTMSGGMDSAVMAHLFSKTNYDFGIAHCNFSLRGKESDGDSEFVEMQAEKYQKPFHVKYFETHKFADENKYSIQESARILRYKWFKELSGEFNYQKIATASNPKRSQQPLILHRRCRIRDFPKSSRKIQRPIKPSATSIWSHLPISAPGAKSHENLPIIWTCRVFVLTI